MYIMLTYRPAITRTMLVRGGLVAALVVCGRAASAQTLSFALVGGPGAATIADFRDTGPGSALERRTGVLAGVSFEIPVAAGVALVPEIVYTQKGVGVDAPAAPRSAARASVFERFDYVEMPLLARVGAAGGRRGAYGIAGPMLAILVRARERFEAPGIPIAEADLMDGVTHLDAGAVFGGGVSAGRIDLELRADIGLRTLIPPADRRAGDSEPRNRSLAALVRWRP